MQQTIAAVKRIDSSEMQVQPVARSSGTSTRKHTESTQSHSNTSVTVRRTAAHNNKKGMSVNAPNARSTSAQTHKHRMALHAHASLLLYTPHSRRSPKHAEAARPP